MTITLNETQINQIIYILKSFNQCKTAIDNILNTYIELNPHPIDILYILFPEEEANKIMEK